MKIDLSNQLAIVTGSSAGIGLAIAAKLFENNASIVLNGRSLTKLKQIEQDLKNRFPQISATIQLVEADLGTKEGVQTLLDQVPTCTILVNNLGIYFPKSFENTSDDDWNKIWEVNVMSGVRLSRHYLKNMLKNNWGRIVFISSESAVNIASEMIHYSTSKAAQVAIARGISEMTVGTAVTSNSVLVGPTYSEGVQDFIRSMAEQKHISQEEAKTNFFTDIRPSSLIKRFIQPEEIGNLVAYLCSSEAAAINGSPIRIEGGIIKSSL